MMTIELEVDKSLLTKTTIVLCVVLCEWMIIRKIKSLE